MSNFQPIEPQNFNDILSFVLCHIKTMCKPFTILGLNNQIIQIVESKEIKLQLLYKFFSPKLV